MTDSSDVRRTLELHLQLRSLFESQRGGTENTDARRRVRELCALATRAIPDSFCKIKLSELENHADALFSDRKHQRWAGALALRHRAFAVLDDLDRRVHYLMAASQFRKTPGNSNSLLAD